MKSFPAQKESAVGVRQFVWKDEHGKYQVVQSPDELQVHLDLQSWSESREADDWLELAAPVIHS